MLKGYKTYISAGIIFILGGLSALNIITKEQFESIGAMAAALLAYGFRDAMK